MLCTEHETPIDDYLDDELGQEERAWFEEHLATCPSCQQELASARSLFASLEGLQPVQEPAGFKKGVLAGLPRRTPLPLGRGILAGQTVVTMALLVLAYPLLATCCDS